MTRTVAPPEHPLAMRDELARLVRLFRYRPYQVATFNLAAARSEGEFNLAGDSLYIESATDDSVTLKVRLNEQGNDQLTFRKGLGIKGFPFYRFFASWEAQPGKSVTLWVYTSQLFDITDRRSSIAEQPTVALASGRKTSATPGTAVPLVGGSTPCRWVDVSALPENTAAAAIGDSLVNATAGAQRGAMVYPTTNPMRYVVDDVSRLYLDVKVIGEGVCFTYGL